MIARMRYTTTFFVLVSLQLTGCQSADTPKMRADGQQPNHQLISDDSQAIDGSENPDINAETFLAAGQLHESQGRLVAATQQYQLAVLRAPDNVTALNRFGLVLIRLGRLDKAEQVFSHAIEVADQHAYLYNNLAFTFMVATRWDDAEASLLRALELHDNFPRARVNLAVVLAQQNHFDESLKQFRLAMPAADAYYNIGLMYQSKRKLVEAARAFKQALELDPELASARKQLDGFEPDVLREAEKPVEEVTALPLAPAVEPPTATRPAAIAQALTGPVQQPMPCKASVTTKPAAVENTLPQLEPWDVMLSRLHDLSLPLEQWLGTLGTQPYSIAEVNSPLPLFAAESSPTKR